MTPKYHAYRLLRSRDKFEPPHRLVGVVRFELTTHSSQSPDSL